MNAREIIIGSIGSLIAVLVIAFIPIDKWVQDFPWWLKILIIIIILLSYWGYKIYQWKTTNIEVGKIQNLENFGLQIENKKILSEETTIRKNNIIYFPVMPTSKPNMIHLLFAFYIKKLLTSGLYVNIFIFDDYCMRKDGNNQSNIDSDVTNFINVFKKYIGEKYNRRLNIIKESSFIKSKKKSRKILISLLGKSSELTRGEMELIQRDKPINDTEAFSRYMKPLYNMLFLSLTSKKYGFTLSGLDEKPLWDCYNKNFKVESYKLCNLYIPTINNTQARDTSNIVHSANNDLILNTVKNNFTDINNISSNSNISLFLKILIFGDNKCVTYTGCNGNSITINSWENLIQSIIDTNDSEKENIYKSISSMINNLINSK